MANNPSSPSAGDMSFSVELPSFSDTDIVSFQPSNTHKAGNVKEIVKRAFLSSSDRMNEEMNSTLKINLSGWINSGLDCDILKVGGSKGWEKGKVKFKIVIEFYPDEPELEEFLTNDKQKLNQAESSLDDIRRTMNN